MQFNSFIFILLFLPLTIIGYFFLVRIRTDFGKIVIIIASIVFYAYADWSLLWVFGISILVNLGFSKLINKSQKKNNLYTIFPIIINVSLLLYFKYSNFLLQNISDFRGVDFIPRKIMLPVGISFFTFQQIAYLVAVARSEIKRINAIDYLAYILYFPKILMGPLMDPVDFINQLNDNALRKLDWDNIARGVQIFSFGLFKKLMLADVFASAVSWGFGNLSIATSIDWVLIMLFYTFEIYFDFSGYSDMAVGSSLMLNITLPINFDSPYRALSVRDFWKRWHISLTKFFTKHIYIPLGGSQKGTIFTYTNTMIVFLVSGLWHGANWTFILWGGIYGVLMVLDRILEKLQKKIFEPVRWVTTFTIVNILWLLFRSESVLQWINILKKILSFENTTISEGLISCFWLPEKQFLEDALHLGIADNIRGFWMLVFILGAFSICLIPGNNYKKLKNISLVSMLTAAISFVWGFICLSGESVFVYFNF